ncbi:aspartate/glutamate racemase family protein [Knoellia subterranea]|uniref:Aspartate racemase n=1 Tax=Knoellia subterranea KCTC 19937 TaxID=1385521 RepID=A0A0A0JKT1_9MICO|nr:aspartate/glutamate racemase family protein [Knoellia subterranea]KGN37374.1 aspartate racemase [Knoellia subterranea KCTC 19937]
MRTLGVLGGMSWTSTASYYRLLNEGVAARLGGLRSARLLVHSVDFAPVAAAQHEDDWDATLAILAEAAQGLVRGGAEGLLLATNTMHKIADELEQACGTPLLHIADATADAILAAGQTRVGLLATAFTMEQDFYVGRLRDRGIEVVIPDAGERAEVHRIIYDELCLDVVREESRAIYRDVIGSLVGAGAEAVILGCTEISLLVRDEDSPVPLHDTTRIHAAAGIDFLLT